MTVYLIESETLEFGLDLSQPVLESAHKVIADIQRTIDDYRLD